MITVCFTNIVGRGKGKGEFVKKYELAKDGVCNNYLWIEDIFSITVPRSFYWHCSFLAHSIEVTI